MRGHEQAQGTADPWRSEDNSGELVSLSTMWVLGIKDKPVGGMASIFIHCPSALAPRINIQHCFCHSHTLTILLCTVIKYKYELKKAGITIIKYVI